MSTSVSHTSIPSLLVENRLIGQEEEEKGREKEGGAERKKKVGVDVARSFSDEDGQTDRQSFYMSHDKKPHFRSVLTTSNSISKCILLKTKCPYF